MHAVTPACHDYYVYAMVIIALHSLSIKENCRHNCSKIARYRA